MGYLSFPRRRNFLVILTILSLLIPMTLYLQPAIRTSFAGPFNAPISVADLKISASGQTERRISREKAKMESRPIGSTTGIAVTSTEEPKPKFGQKFLNSDRKQPKTRPQFSTAREKLACFQSALGPFLNNLEKTRQQFIARQSVWSQTIPSNLSRTVLYSENRTFFGDLAQNDAIRTVFLGKRVDRMKNCLVGEGNFHYDYGTNDCARVLSMAKRHTMFGETLYNMSCVTQPSEIFKSKPILPASLKVGLPKDFVHDASNKTWTYVHVIHNGIITVYGDITVGDVDIVPQRCYPERRVELPSDPSLIPLYDEVFSLSQYYGAGIFHANIEDTSRVTPYLQFLNRHPNIKIHIFDLNAPPIFLSLLGLDPGRFIDGTIRAKTLYQPAGVNCCLPTLLNTQLESLHLRAPLPNLPPDTIVLIRRRRRRNRFFINNKSILTMLEEEARKYGLHVWEFRDDPVPPLNVTTAMFNRALMVVAPHGAGESNLVFTQPGTVLLEGLCIDKSDGLVNLVFRTLSHLVGGYYYGYLKPDDHCTAMSSEELRPYVQYFLSVLTTSPQ